ncbi:hypothetical protein [Streptomyces sp. NPDC055099]
MSRADRLTGRARERRRTVVVFLVILIGVIVGAGLVGYGFSAFARRDSGPARLGAVLRGLAALTAAVAVGLCVWGALHVAGAVVAAADGGTSSSPVREAGAPGYVMPAALALTVAAGALAVCAALASGPGIRSRTPPA